MYTKKNNYATNNKKEKGNEKEKNIKAIKRGSVAMQQINFLFKNKESKEDDLIDSLIKEIVDMDKTSANRFNEYSHIFDQIKNQISDINNSLLSGNILNNTHYNIDSFSNKMSSSRQKIKIENTMFKHYIKEEKDINLNLK